MYADAFEKEVFQNSHREIDFKLATQANQRKSFEVSK